MRRTAIPVALLLLVWVGGSSTQAVQTRIWTQTPEELQRGESEGMAVTSRGRLFLAPRLVRHGESMASGEPAHVWCAIADPAGNIYLGTGPDGRIVKVATSGKQSIFFSVTEPMVTALALLPGGDLLAGTAPEGKIYRVHPDGKGTVWCETGERYVWSLAPGAGGAVFAGTGEHGIIFEVDSSGRAQPFFDSDEGHIVSLVPMRDGGLLAGGAGRGLVYRIDREGHALVLHDDDLPEVKSLALAADGSVIAAALASPKSEPRLPAVRIEVPGAGGGEAGASPDAMGGLDERPGQMIAGIIEGLSPASEEPSTGLRGRVIKIGPKGDVVELWHSYSEAPFALTLDASGRALFGAGEPARLYRVEPGGEVSLLATLREAQVTGLVTAGRSLVVATSNPASTYRVEDGGAGTGTFLSHPFDAGGMARWGTLRWRVEGAPNTVEFYTRTGNSAEPDATWSAWSPALTNPEGNPIVNPEGHFLQWRARLVGAHAEETRILGATASFAPRNRAPSLREFRLEPAATAVSSKASFRWSSTDPDGDALGVEVQFRKPGALTWATGVRVEAPARPESGSDQEAGWKDGKAVWDVSAVEEGAYEVRAAASDQGANAPGDGGDSTAELSQLLVVDRTPPVLEARRVKGGGVEIRVTDSLSSIGRLEVVAEGRLVFTARPDDGVCDSPRETFHLSPDEAGTDGKRTLRTVDAAGNTAETPVPAQ